LFEGGGAAGYFIPTFFERLASARGVRGRGRGSMGTSG
jgi:hypothetical protein